MNEQLVGKLTRCRDFWQEETQRHNKRLKKGQQPHDFTGVMEYNLLQIYISHFMLPCEVGQDLRTVVDVKDVLTLIN
jgi:hypothetical protein